MLPASASLDKIAEPTPVVLVFEGEVSPVVGVV